MDEIRIIRDSIFEFFAKWFENIKSTVFQTSVSNVRDFESIIPKVEIPTEIRVSNLSDVVIPEPKDPPTTVSVSNLGDIVIPPVPQFPEINIPPYPEFPEITIPDTVEVSNMPKIPEVKIPKEFKVSNFPKTQDIKGEVSLKDFKKIIEGMQVIVDAINDLKLEIGGISMGGATVTAVPMGSHKEVMDGLTKYDPDDSAPDYVGTHHSWEAADSDGEWQILKYTYDDNNVTQVQRKKGAWSDRASLF